MAHNDVQVLYRCIVSKTFWCALLMAATWTFLLVSHSYRTCAVMLVFVMIGLFAIYEEDHEDELEDLP